MKKSQGKKTRVRKKSMIKRELTNRQNNILCYQKFTNDICRAEQIIYLAHAWRRRIVESIRHSAYA